jgi:glycine hydroxymethyltransferase
MAAKAVALTEAATPAFQDYARRIVVNSQALAEALQSKGAKVLTGGTDNHLVMLDVRPFGLTGMQASDALRAAHITVNKNAIPNDPNGAWNTSGVRLGTPALTTLGLGPEDMKEIASIIHSVLSTAKPDIIASGPNAGKPSKAKVVVDPKAVSAGESRVRDLLAKHPLYPGIEL